MENQVNDSALLKRYRKGDEKAFEVLVNRYQSKVYTTIYLIVKDRCVAEDIFQETFIKAVNTIKVGKYNEEGKFLPWLLRIAHNKAIDHFRRSRRYPVIPATTTGEDGETDIFNRSEFAEESHESVQIRQETRDHVRELIETLPETQREVLVMRHYADMSFKEISEATGVSINTALGRMRYALINLRKELNKHKAYDENFYPN